MLCHQCGSPVDATDRSCPNCGASLVKTTRFDIATSKGLRISQELKAIKLDDQMFPPGETIEKRYRLGELIGKGPFGEVFKAHDTELDVDVAIKIFHKSLIHTPIQQERFASATRHARGMSQANVVRMHDSGVHKDHPWVSMQYLEGLSLRKVLGLRRSKGENFGLDEIEPVIGQIGLALAHTERDTACANLKPENIIFMPDLLKVTDTYVLAAFGLDALRERSNDSAIWPPNFTRRVPSLTRGPTCTASV
ncbi:MAG: inactive serine/threonine-protein kinase VRK3 [bacterium]